MQLLSNISRLIFFSFLLNSLTLPCFALDFTPRLWSHLPIGLNFAGVAYADTEADIAVNPVTRLEDVDLGVALAVRLPTGQYKDDKLINLGQNRFVFRPQLGVSHTRGKWTTEVTGEVAFYTDNDDFNNGKTREQDPTYIFHGHLMHTFRPGLWVGSSIAYDFVGKNSIDGIDSNDKKENFGWTLNFAYPINRQSGFNVAYIATRKQKSTGLDSDTLSASLAFSW